MGHGGAGCHWVLEPGRLLRPLGCPLLLSLDITAGLTMAFCVNIHKASQPGLVVHILRKQSGACAQSGCGQRAADGDVAVDISDPAFSVRAPV